MNSFFRVLLHLLFPATCVLCHEDLSEGLVPPLCVSCQRKIPVALNINMNPTSDLHSLVSMVPFKGATRELIHSFKYEGKDYLSKWIGAWMVHRMPELTREVDCVVPVPMPFWRETKRGYNQATLLAEEIAKHLKISLKSRWLKRKNFNSTQIGLSKEKRAKNATASFWAPLHLPEIKDRQVLLVDDVVTTGSTLKQCAYLLRSRGAKSVTAIVFARDQMF